MTMSRFGVLLLAGLTGLPAAAASSEGQDAAEYEVKAAFLYNFTLHVEWPARAFRNEGSPFVICILGKDPFGGALDRAVEGKTAQERRLQVVRADRVEDLKPCHVLFVPDSERREIGRAREALKDSHALIVGESPGAAREGAALNFIIEERRVRLEVNLEEAKRADLKIGAKLVRIARLIED